ncbi:hypothetical protein [Burkholderia multivorans]|nr:hypothetical protein [Burkholderia multivorans]MBR7890732.1 hypothetical protein [Burkholderia multivorans]MBR8450822.1 hypothetical protein [Burkholderia multivorans]MCA8386854.1 hypothetical protein [Burkholderia multivorans]PRG30599.1 hypothetical protein C6T68_28115 [Burkholderia multivorans]UQN90560.1 hypothetical protein L0Y85_27855 [Burkholderia multivorans]
MSRRLTYRSSYQPMLAWLEEQLNEPMEMGKTKGAWIETDPDGKKWALKPGDRRGTPVGAAHA